MSTSLVYLMCKVHFFGQKSLGYGGEHHSRSAEGSVEPMQRPCPFIQIHRGPNERAKRSKLVVTKLRPNTVWYKPPLPSLAL